MSCMEHTCRGCGETTFDNRPSAPAFCQRCGGTEFTSRFDELPEPEDRDDDDDDA